MMQNKRKGFTIIELMLAMGFLSALLVTIALLVIQITGIYQKGLALRAVSSQGKQLIDEFSRVVGGAPINDNIRPVADASGNVSNSAIRAAYESYYVSFPRGGGAQQYGGVFCTGLYSYVWNTRFSYVDDDRMGTPLTVNGTKYKMARVRDDSYNLCAQANGSAAGQEGNPRTNLVASDLSPIELINSDEADLIMYDFAVFPATQNGVTGQAFYSATFILATIRGGININSSADFCDVSEGSGLGLATDFNYCAVNKFNFAMRSTGYSEGEDQYDEGRDDVNES